MIYSMKQQQERWVGLQGVNTAEHHHSCYLTAQAQVAHTCMTRKDTHCGQVRGGKFLEQVP